MRKLLTRVAAVAAALTAFAAAGPARAQYATLTTGTSWVNELGSVLTIDSIAGNGLMTGSYVTKVGCDAGSPQPMTGWYFAGSTGGAMTFTVNFQGCNSITSWTGQYNYSNGSIQTLWYLAAAVAPTWNAINAGADMFVQQGAMKK